MIFGSSRFLILLLCLYPLWWAVRKNSRVSLIVLLAGSAVFYGSDKQVLLLYLIGYCALAWAVGIFIEESHDEEDAGAAKRWMVSGVAVCILGLSFFKYTPMIADTLAFVIGEKTGDSIRLAVEYWTVPIGISFFSFTSITYIVDVYRRKFSAERDILRVSLYLSFFPKLLSGPIVRPSEFLKFLRPGEMPSGMDFPLEALHLIARGFFKKAVLASRLSVVIDPYFMHVAGNSTAGVWSLPYLYLYALQIYLDFSAYTDIARGLGLMCGFRWPQNFNLPYAASNVREFWQRWHMTLSRFLRDYLYIPLGGNRGSSFRTAANLLITMILGGLWHGASWSFGVWGMLHGLYLIVNRLWTSTSAGKYAGSLMGMAGRLWKWMMVFVTFTSVSVAWGFFRITDISQALVCVKKVIVFERPGLLKILQADTSLWWAMLFYAFASYTISRLMMTVSNDDNPPQVKTLNGFRGGFAIGFGVSLLALSWLLSAGKQAPFIYFQF